MSLVLSHRGADHAGIWTESVVGLGQRLLWTTPESVYEHFPMESPRADIVVTADARIDNREELIAALGLTSATDHELPDSALILAAYERWGERCPERLLGDFAFALWDRRQRKVFCARDHFGVRPFYYYHRAKEIFAFGSEIKALLSLNGIPRQLNELHVGNYLAGIFEDKSSTFYQDIMRLAPAHSATVNSQELRLHCYWRLDPASEVRLRSDEEYAVAYREIFTEAVRCRLRSAFPRGSHLSGGLDSSSVTCVARRLTQKTDAPLWHTFSNVFEEVSECDERPFINAVLAQDSYIPHYVYADQSSPLVDLERVFWHQEEPAIGPNHYLPWQLNQAAADCGVRVVLDGFDGDTTVSHGAARFAELADAGKWATFADEAKAVSRHFRVSPFGLLQAYGLKSLGDLAKCQRWLAFAATVGQLNHFFHVSRCDLIWRYGFKSFAQLKTKESERDFLRTIDPVINRNFARSIGLWERVRRLKGEVTIPRTVREDHWLTLTSPQLLWVLELSDRCAAAFSLDVRHPFMDKRLIEFCLALPAEQKLDKGWSRIIMRRAMAGILPNEICWRGGKTDMNPNFIYGLLKKSRRDLDEVVNDLSETVERFVDSDKLRELHQRLISQRKIKVSDAMTFWKVTTLAYWLRQSGLDVRKSDTINRPKRQGFIQ